MIYWQNGLFLLQGRLALDVTRRQPVGFISHAHADHIAPHELAMCTPATAKFYRHRRGQHRAVQELTFGHSITFSGLQLTTYPAGHILGSAMLLADDGHQRMLYTGDFKLGESATAEVATLPTADILVLECTFGDPKYRLPPREEVLGELLQTVTRCFEDGKTPVIYAYVLGKAQEVTRILTQAGIPVQQHPEIFVMSQLYEESGCPLGNYALYDGVVRPGHVLVVPPASQKRAAQLTGVTRPFKIAVTGWALRSDCRHWLRVDAAFPVSDHADFDELLQAVEQVSPQQVFCTHGPASFAEILRERGVRAENLNPALARKSSV
ncbi:MAG: MBL fold metallo-hydrolase [Planctomycetota bacterium]|nr:MBL fold metallo-hydrolase [Planctomycetota bacterium]MDA1177404.1 MBL fold metallo-hydrolase [Planctomycetota bacterium]